MAPDKSKDIFVCINNQRMSVLILLIAFSILIAGGFLAAFIWSVKKGQFDDDYTPSVRILMDDMPKTTDATTASEEITEK